MKSRLYTDSYLHTDIVNVDREGWVLGYTLMLIPLMHHTHTFVQMNSRGLATGVVEVYMYI